MNSLDLLVGSLNDGVKILRRRQVENLTGLSRSTLYAEIKAGRFPKQVPLTSKRCVGWIAGEIEEYIQSRVSESRDQSKGGM